MNKVQIEDNFSVSEQITLDDIKDLADDNVKILICNRPDSEEPNQITCAEIKAESDAHGIQFIHIPVAGKEIPEESLAEFVKVIDECNDNIHAYCKTGTRSSIFWALSHARNHPTDDVLVKTSDVGINLTPVADQIETINRKHSNK